MVGFLDKVLGPNPVELLADEHVLPAIIALIDEAEKFLILVSPYNDYSVHLRDAVDRTAKRLADVVAVYRKEQGKKEQKHIDWLSGLGARVYPVERLHAKIYANESQVILTSMNLLQSSATNSKEIALRISDQELRDQVIDYIRTRLVGTSSPHKEAPSGSAKAASTAAKRATTRSTTKAPTRATAKAATQGYCVRCQKSISFSLNRPLCDDCYPTWAKFKDPDYSEKFCLSCGQQRKNISYAKPQCRSCWQKSKVK